MKAHLDIQHDGNLTTEGRTRMSFDENSKRCPKCDLIKPRSEFYADKRLPSGLQSHCKNCVLATARSKYATDPDYRAKNLQRNRELYAANPSLWRNKHLVRKYNITRAEYDALLVVQGGVCTGCKYEPKPDENLDVDHDHACCAGQKSCGKCVRGLLCRGCNTILGLARDDAQVLVNLITYLEKGIES